VDAVLDSDALAVDEIVARIRTARPDELRPRAGA
jgi:hypothetical protein